MMKQVSYTNYGTLEFTLDFLPKYIPTFDTVRNLKKIKCCLPLKMALIIE